MKNEYRKVAVVYYEEAEIKERQDCHAAGFYKYLMRTTELRLSL